MEYFHNTCSKQLPSTETYGYVRVSSKDQCADRQIIALKQFPVKDKNIFVDKMSGKDFNRPNYLKLQNKLCTGDLLVISSIDRLGRNYDEILEQWRIITKKKKADIVVLDMPILDTRQSKQGLTGTFISDLVLQILSYVAQTERENIRRRQKEGIEAAMLRGVHFGRPKKTPPDSFDALKAKWMNREISSREAARILGISQNTFLRWIHKK